MKTTRLSGRPIDYVTNINEIFATILLVGIQNIFVDSRFSMKSVKYQIETFMVGYFSFLCNESASRLVIFERENMHRVQYFARALLA